METENYTEGLLFIDKKIRNNAGLARPSNINDSISLVLTHIISSVIGKKSIFFVNKEFVDKETLATAIYLWCVGYELVRFSEPAGLDHTQSTEICASAGKAIFQLLDTEIVQEAMSRGLEHYHKTLEVSETMENVEIYLEQISKAVYCYVRSTDEKLLDIFTDLFNSMLISAEEQNT